MEWALNRTRRLLNSRPDSSRLTGTAKVAEMVKQVKSEEPTTNQGTLPRPHCTATTPPLYCSHAPTVLQPRPHCTAATPPLYCSHAPTVLQPRPHCTATTPPLYCSHAPTVLQPRPFLPLLPLLVQVLLFWIQLLSFVEKLERIKV